MRANPSRCRWLPMGRGMRFLISMSKDLRAAVDGVVAARRATPRSQRRWMAACRRRKGRGRVVRRTRRRLRRRLLSAAKIRHRFSRIGAPSVSPAVEVAGAVGRRAQALPPTRIRVARCLASQRGHHNPNPERSTDRAQAGRAIGAHANQGQRKECREAVVRGSPANGRRGHATPVGAHPAGRMTAPVSGGGATGDQEAGKRRKNLSRSFTRWSRWSIEVSKM